MARKGRPRKWDSLLRRYLAELQKIPMSPEHINGIRRVVTKAFEFFDQIDPILVKESEIREFINQWDNVTTRRFYKTNLNGYLKFCDNYVIEKMRWPRSSDVRFRVRWLSQEQVNVILGMDMNPRDEIIIHLALDMALRRAEIKRTRLKDFNPDTGFLDVRGKGNKRRSVPFSPDFYHIYDRYLQYREDFLEKWKKPDPGNMILVRYRGNVKGIGVSALDETCDRISENARTILKDPTFRFSFHDLRRTWARTAWELGIPIETIALVLGHSDIRTTLLYIGANADHAVSAMQQVHKFRSQQMTQSRRVTE